MKTVDENIKILRSKGYPEKVAIEIAMSKLHSQGDQMKAKKKGGKVKGADIKAMKGIK